MSEFIFRYRLIIDMMPDPQHLSEERVRADLGTLLNGNGLDYRIIDVEQGSLKWMQPLEEVVK